MRNNWVCQRTKTEKPDWVQSGVGGAVFNHRCTQTFRLPHSLLGTTEPEGLARARVENSRKVAESGERMPVCSIRETCVSRTGCGENSLGFG